jgi:hypothetical protein
VEVVIVAAKTALTVTMQIDGVRDTLAAFRELPKDASAELRRRTLQLSETLADAARRDGMADEAPQSRLVARTVRAQKDRTPAVVAGGNRKLGRHRTPAYTLLFASVFGQNRRSGWYAKPRYGRSGGRQYRRHGGRDAYWFFPVIEQEQPQIARAWQQVADSVVREFAGGG